LDCRQAEELLSDHLEKSLVDPLRSDLAAHLATCAGCRGLYKALSQVVEALRDHPVLEPSTGLASRLADAALAGSQPRPHPAFVWRFRSVPLGMQAAAAALALVVTGLVYSASSAGGVSRMTLRLRERSVNTGVYLLEKKDRLVEDIRILRVVVGAAFGSRVDRVNDRVDDYRRLLQKRPKKAEPEGKKAQDEAKSSIFRTSGGVDSYRVKRCESVTGGAAGRSGALIEGAIV
jgi:hypothetical protein